jgi:polyisoprenyl-phosphate glycosyltransferase
MNETGKPKLSIILPCYNEVDNLELILNRFNEVITREDIEIIVVDNGSNDGTDELLSRLLPKFPFARRIRICLNQGYGSGILAGLKEASGEYMGWTHADMQADPLDTMKALKFIEENNEPDNIYVKGIRKGRPLTDRFFTLGMSVFETMYLAAPLRDINAQPNVFPRAFFETWKNPPHDFSLDLYAMFTAHKQGLDMVRFPVDFSKRKHGVSKWNTGLSSRLNMIKRTFAFSAGLKRNFKNGIHSPQNQHD